MNEIRSSSETLEGITRHLNEHGGSFSLVRVDAVWVALINPDDDRVRVYASGESAGDAVEGLLQKVGIPRIPQFAVPPVDDWPEGHPLRGK